MLIKDITEPGFYFVWNEIDGHPFVCEFVIDGELIEIWHGERMLELADFGPEAMASKVEVPLKPTEIH